MVCEKYLMTPGNVDNKLNIPVELFVIAPLLALSNSIILGFCSGLIFSILLLLVAGSVSLIRNFIVRQLRIPLLILITATWISLFDMLLTAWFYDLRQQLGVYLPLLAVNSLVFAATEEYYLALPLRKSLSHALRIAGLVMLLFLVMGGLRELLTHGSLFRDAGLIVNGSGILHPEQNHTDFGLVLAGKAPGAFICLGLVIAVWNYIAGTLRTASGMSKQGHATGIE